MQAVSVRTRLDKIVITSGAILAKSLENDTSLDPRLEDWLSSNEPDMCLWILNDTEKLVSTDSDSGGKWWHIINHAIHSVCIDAKINEAIKLFSDREAIFHFLLRPDVWNCGIVTQGAQPEMGHSIESHAAISQTDLIHGQKEGQEVPIPSANTSYGRIEDPPERQKTVDPGKINMLTRWLDGLDCNDKYESTLRLRQPNTCAWLLETNQYNAWKNGEDSFLWLQGKPGAGKTVLTTFVIETVRKMLQEGEFIGFFYCDFRNERRATNAAGVMRSILSQLLRKLEVSRSTDKGLIQLIDDMVKQQSEGPLVLKYADNLASFISRIARQFDRRSFVVIDALDECQDIENLLYALRQLSSSNGICLFITSRPLQVIKDSFHSLPSISMERMAEKVSADIKLHVAKEVEGNRRLRVLEEDLKAEIWVALQSGADGMFRWIQCQIDVLKKCATAKDIRKALQNLPSGLEETYERILQEIDPLSSEGTVAMRALTWLVAALRPMKLVEMLEVLLIDIEAQRLDSGLAPVHGHVLLDALGSLVVHDEETDLLNLSHFTVKEYLVGSLTIREKQPMHHIDLQEAHVNVLRHCVVYITTLIHHLQLFGTDKGRHTYQRASCGSFLLLDYVFFYGFDHLKHVEVASVPVLDDMVALRFDIQHHPAEWAQILKRVSSLYLTYQCLSPKHDFIVYVLISLPEPHLRSFLCHAPFKVFEETNPLVYAAYFGKIQHARTLLSCGTNVHRTGLDVQAPHQVLPIEVAFYRGHCSLFNLFLVHCRTPIPPRMFSTVFDAQYWSYDPSVILELLRSDDFMEWAAEGRDEKILSVLSKKNILNQEEKIFLPILCRFVQVCCTPSRAPDTLQLSLQVAWHAVSRGDLALLQYLYSQGVPMPSRVLFGPEPKRGRTLAGELSTSLGWDVGGVVAEGNLVLENTFGKCKYGSGCWMTDCSVCSMLFDITGFKRGSLMDILVVGSRDNGKESFINTIAGLPEGIPGSSAQVSGSSSGTMQATSYASLLGSLPLQIWDLPDFEETLITSSQRIAFGVGDSRSLPVASNQRKDSNSELDDDSLAYPTPQISQVVWYMSASSIDNPAAWRKFRDVYTECHSRLGALPSPLVVASQTNSVQLPSDWKIICKEKLHQLCFRCDVSKDIQVYQDGRIEHDLYKSQSLVLRQLLRQNLIDFLLSSTRSHYESRFELCLWVVSGGFVCGQAVIGSDFNNHMQHHYLEGQSNVERITCCWIGCDKQMHRSSLGRHLWAIHLLYRYGCPFCSRRFSRGDTFRTHLKKCIV